MANLNALIDSRELSISCWHCGWNDQRPLSWFGSKRDMACPTCRSVIVLNTCDRKREIASLRRQVASLHKQLVDTIPAAEGFLARPTQSTAPGPKMELLLMHVYRGAGSRRATRVRR